MKEIFQQTGPDKTVLGNVITSWIYKPPRSNKFVYAVLGLLGGLVIFLILYGDSLIPYIKRIPALAIYAAIFLLSPLLKYLSSKGRDQHWTLYKNGFSVQVRGRTGATEESLGYWRDYRHCTYNAKGVRLIAANPMRKSIRLPATFNVMEIYSICRERISLAQAIKLDRSSSAPERPKTREQRQLSRTERKVQTGQTGGSLLEKLFPEIGNQGSESEGV